MNKKLWGAIVLVVPMMLGCGADIGQELLLAGESALRTAADVLISDAFSELPEVVSVPGVGGEPVDDGEPAGDDGSADDDDQDGAGGGGDDPPPPPPDDGGDDLTGDADLGADLFSANSCAACHCPDAAGGCLPGAPNIQGAGFATVKERLQGEVDHPGGKFPEMTDQDIADLVAFLAEIG